MTGAWKPLRVNSLEIARLRISITSKAPGHTQTFPYRLRKVPAQVNRNLLSAHGIHNDRYNAFLKGKLFIRKFVFSHPHFSITAWPMLTLNFMTALFWRNVSGSLGRNCFIRPFRLEVTKMAIEKKANFCHSHKFVLITNFPPSGWKFARRPQPKWSVVSSVYILG